MSLRFRVPRALAGASIALVGLALATATTAHADTARLKIAKRDGGTYPTRVVVTSATGVSRTLGPFDLPTRSSRLVASPDGRYLALEPGAEARDGGITIVRLDGGAPVPLQPSPGITLMPSLSGPSWAPDGSELVVSHAGVDQDAPDALVWPVLRCPAPAFLCRTVDGGNAAAAAAVPGGVVLGSTVVSLFPATRALAVLPTPGSQDEWLVRGSPSARELQRLVTVPVESRITLVSGEQRQTISVTRRSARRGIPVTTAIVGGVSGALLSQEVYRVAVRSREGVVGGTARTSQRRLVQIAADGTARTTTVPRLTVPRADSAPHPVTGRRKAERVPVVPAIGLPAGGWLATAGAQPELADHSLTLVRIDAGGSARFVRTNGRIVSARSLVRAVPGAAPVPGQAGVRVVGYEQATDAAIVVVRWSELGRRWPAAATVRVPLDGRTAPTVISREREQAAW